LRFETAKIYKSDRLLGARRVQTRLYRDIAISEGASSLTLEIMSRFSANPRWLIYLPPTMSPSGTSKLDTFLEHPLEAFDYYKKRGVTKIICEEKHMGSRAVIVLCRNSETAKARFGIAEDTGIIYTRTGRHFFDEKAHEQAILARLRSALDASGFWESFSTDWVCLDTELMPWSAKARALLLEQYAPTGTAGRNGLAKAIEALNTAQLHTAQMSHNGKEAVGVTLVSGTPGDMDIAAVLADYQHRRECLERYAEAYRRYCWPVASVDDYRVAPFHILATEGRVWHNENHLHHLSVIRKYITESEIFIPTNHLIVDLANEASAAAAVDWWMNLTGSGGEGMVVKPLDFIAHEKNSLVQPAVKCRGREYLRIIYGPDYTTAAHLDRLRKRSLRRKQELALAEFAMGMESLERFVNKEPFYRVHECVFAVLALENEEVDPRL
jgi:protein phosphatase